MTSAGGKRRTCTANMTLIMVADMIPNPASGVMHDNAVAKNAPVVVSDVTKIAFDARRLLYSNRSERDSPTPGSCAL